MECISVCSLFYFSLARRRFPKNSDAREILFQTILELSDCHGETGCNVTRLFQITTLRGNSRPEKFYPLILTSRQEWLFYNKRKSGITPLKV